MPTEVHLGKDVKIIHHEYGSKKGEESKSRRDYMTKRKTTKKKVAKKK